MEQTMFDQAFESFRKASESSLQMQQDMIKYWSQQSLSAPPNVAGASTDWSRTFQKHWLELTVEILNRHRESLDSTYRSAIQAIEQTFHASEAKSSEDYHHLVEDVLRKAFETVKGQSERQFGDLQKWAAKSFEVIQKVSE
jgi:chromosomal replication initiation ATPase DnaA